jgi:TolB-like protein
MNKLSASSLIILFFFRIGFFSVEVFGQPKPHIAVLNLEGREISESEVATLSDQLRGHLVSLGAFIVLDRGKMESILKEQSFQQTGCTLTECAIKAGRILNVQKIVTGSIGKIGKTYAINISMINVESSRIEKSFNRNYEGKIDGLLDILKDIAQEIAGRKLYKLTIHSSPKGAEVILNNKYLGKTPLARQAVAGSNLKIWVKQAGYKDWEKTVTITKDEELNIEMKKLQGQKKKSSSRAWLWVAGGVGAAALGATAYIMNSNTGGGKKSENLPPFQWPPEGK